MRNPKILALALAALVTVPALSVQAATPGRFMTKTRKVVGTALGVGGTIATVASVLSAPIPALIGRLGLAATGYGLEIAATKADLSHPRPYGEIARDNRRLLLGRGLQATGGLVLVGYGLAHGDHRITMAGAAMTLRVAGQAAVGMARGLRSVHW